MESKAGAAHISLGSVSDVTAGPSGSLLSNLHDGPDGVPVISPADFADYNTVDTQHLRRVPSGEARKLARFALREGDLLIVRQGPIGRLALTGAEHAGWFYGSSCLRIRPDRQRILPAYLASYLSYPPVREALLSRALPGTVPSLNSAMVNELPVTVPSLELQQAIIETLGDIDAQIRIQRAIADRLETLRPAVFGDLIKELANV